MVVEPPDGEHLGGEPDQLQHTEDRYDHKGARAAQTGGDLHEPQDANPLEQGTAGDHDAVGIIGVQLHARLLSWAIMDRSISAQTVERFSDRTISADDLAFPSHWRTEAPPAEDRRKECS